MKKIFLILAITMFANSLSAQFNGGSFDNIVNLGAENSLELLPGQKMSREEKLADDLVSKAFGSLGLNTKTNENPLIHVSNYKGKELQTWQINMVAENEYVIINKSFNMALTLEKDGKAEKAKIIPAPYQEGNNNQVFTIVRSEKIARYACFFISKISGMAITVDEKSKELYQSSKQDENKFQIWYMSNRQTIRIVSDGKYLSLNKSETFFPNAQVILNAQQSPMTCNWELINHPSGTGVYFIMNSFSKKFISVSKDKDGKSIEGANIVQTDYNVNFNLLFNFEMTADKKAYLIHSYPGKDAALSDVNGTFTLSKTDPENINQHWVLQEPLQSLF